VRRNAARREASLYKALDLIGRRAGRRKRDVGFKHRSRRQLDFTAGSGDDRSRSKSIGPREESTQRKKGKSANKGILLEETVEKSGRGAAASFSEKSRVQDKRGGEPSL